MLNQNTPFLYGPFNFPLRLSYNDRNRDDDINNALTAAEKVILDVKGIFESAISNASSRLDQLNQQLC